MTKLTQGLSEDLIRDITEGLSREAKEIKNIQNFKMSEHFYKPISRQRILTVQFYTLVNEWKEGIRFLSSTTKICMQPSYQKIIGMGSQAVPLILRELEREPSLWFWALESITGENPVLPEHRGNFNRMLEDWLTWAKANGYNC